MSVLAHHVLLKALYAWQSTLASSLTFSSASLDGTSFAEEIASESDTEVYDCVFDLSFIFNDAIRIF